MKQGKSKKNIGMRDLGMMAASASGKTQREIADDFGVSRETVARVLNSDEAKRLTDQARSRLQGMLGEAVDTLSEAMTCRGVDMKTAVTAALAILKGSGVLTEKVQLTQLEPFIMKLIGGGEIHMGLKEK